jgi:cobalt-zinc-cadmium efflux system outer membrane protein
MTESLTAKGSRTLAGRLWLCLVLGLAAGANAAEVASVPSGSALADAVEAAWQRAVEAREAESGVAQADAEARAARMWSAETPVVELTNRSGDWGNSPGVRETEVGVAWPVWLPGQRSAGIAAARSGVDVAGAAAHAARLKLAGDVREALWELQSAVAERAGTAAIVDHWKALAADTDRRLAAGDVPRIDALATRAELLAAETAAAEAETAADDAERRWTLLTGLPAPTRAPQIEAAPPDDSAVASDDALADAHPDVRLATLRAQQARAQLKFTRRTPTVAPELRVAMREDVGAPGDPVARSVLVGARVPFGGGARADRIDAAAAGELSSAETAERRARDQQRASLASARRALAAAQRQFAAEDARRALVLERLGLVERSYRAGETSLGEILRERAAAARAEADAARRRATLGLASARLQQALGRLP